MKRNLKLYLVVPSLVLMISACGENGKVHVVEELETNQAPRATDVAIADDNGGVARVNDTLTASYVYLDTESDAEGDSRFQWLRDGESIEGATDITYTVMAEDSGKDLVFTIRPMAASGTSEGITHNSEALFINNSAPSVKSVGVTDDSNGELAIGTVLTGHYTFIDADGDTEGNSIVRWLRAGVAIEGATDMTYTLVAGDVSAPITFEVIPVAEQGELTGTAVASASVVVANRAPIVNNVSITDSNGGDALVGDRLVGVYNYSDAETDPEGSSTFRWLRGADVIVDATANAYELTAQDSGQTIRFEVTPVADSGTQVGSVVLSDAVTVSNSAPTVSGIGISDVNGGNVLVGDQLTGTYTFVDADGDTQASSSFRWLRDGAAITNETGLDYILVAADASAQITFEVTPRAATGTTEGSATVSSALVVNNSAPEATNVDITDDNGGDLVVGDTLTGQYSYSDVENDAEGISTFRWLRDGSAINGAIASTYVVVQADSGNSLSFEATPVAASGTNMGNAVSSAVVTVVNSAPTATGIGINDANGGNALVGDQLTGTYTFVDADGDAEGVSTFRWLRDGATITNQTGLDYTLVAADASAQISFEVTPLAASGVFLGSSSVSGALVVDNSAPVAANVVISDDNGGDLVVGDSLTGQFDYSDVENDAEGTSSFRWLRGGNVISGATNSTYVVVQADSGNSLSFEATPVAVSGTNTGNAVSSVAVNVVNSAAIASNVNISDDNGGSIVMGDHLTGSYNYSDVDGDVEGSSTFRWLRDGAAISGATQSTYLITTADLGVQVTFEVTPVAATGVLGGVASVSAAITGINSAPMATAVDITGDNGGNTKTGDSLAGSYSYSDVDGDVEGSSTFRWLRDGTAISGATQSNYLITAADTGFEVTFEVTPVAVTGSLTGDASVSESITVINTAPIVTAVSVNDVNGGNTVVGDSLSSSYAYSDIDGDLEGASTLRWLQNGSPIAGATGSNYIVSVADVGSAISVEVTPVAISGVISGSAVTSASIAVVNSAPTITEGTSITVNMDEDASPTAFSLTLNATDPEGDGLTWSVASSAAHGQATAYGTAASQSISYVPSINYFGTDSFTIRVTDARGGMDTISVNVAIAPQNDAPVITSSPATTMSEAGYFYFTPYIYDADGTDQHSFSISNQPSWASFNTSTGVLNGLPGHAGVGTYNDIQITATDNGTSPLSGSITFSLQVVDDVAPTLSSSVPSTGATNVSPASSVLKLTAVLNEPLAAGSVNGSTFTLEKTSGGTVPGTVTHIGASNDTAEFIPSVDLEFHTQYTATLTTGITDINGNQLQQPITWSFTTGPLVTALYSAAQNWNYYVNNDGIDRANASNTSCDATQTGGYYKCIHGGEARTVDVPGYNSCTNLTATDTLGAFDWYCDASTTPVRMVSKGLKSDKNLSDLLDFATPAWLLNSVAVVDGVTPLFTTSAAQWWSNPITEANNGGDLYNSGDIYIVTADSNSFFQIGSSNIALVVQPGVSISRDGEILRARFNKNFLWLEGEVHMTGSSFVWGIYWIDVDFSVIRNMGITGGHRSFHLASSTNNKLTNIIAAENIHATSVGIEMVDSSYNNLSNISVYNSGLAITLSNSDNNNFLNSIVANNDNYISGITLDNSSNNALSAINYVNNGGYFYVQAGSDNNILSSVAVVNSSHTGLYLGSNNNTVSNIVSAHNGNDGTLLSNSSDNMFTGLYKTGNNARYDCYANSGPNQGLDHITCANNGWSDATLTTGITLASSFVGNVTTDDTVNTSDTNGTATYATSLDWLSFENPYRSWSIDDTLLSTSTQGWWRSGNGRIVDWSLLATDNVIRAVLSKRLTGDVANTITHSWSDGSTVTYLRDAIEIEGDGIGNDNSLCESNESCLYTPNIGAYQGHGVLQSAGIFTDGDGTITNVTLMEYSINGY